MIIAVDFDDTLCINGNANEQLFNFLIQKQREGVVIILDLCRTGKRLMEAVKFCREHGLAFNAVNQNIPASIKMLGHDPRKIYADMYIDDKAVKP